MLALDRVDILSSRKGLYPFVLLKEEVPTHWVFLEPMIARSVAHSKGTCTVEGIRQSLWSGWGVCLGTAVDQEPVAVLVVEPVAYETYKAVRVIAAAGRDLRGAMAFWHILETYAIGVEATEIEAWCRPAMERLLQRYGFRHKFSIVSVDLRRTLQ